MKIVITILVIVFSLSVLAVPEVVLATDGGGAIHRGSLDSSSVTSLNNPLGVGNNDPRVIVGNIIQAILGIVGSLALLVFILGGLSWVTSAGNDEKVKKGKDMIIWATLGLIVIFTSYTLVRFVLDALVGTATR